MRITLSHANILTEYLFSISELQQVNIRDILTGNFSFYGQRTMDMFR